MKLYFFREMGNPETKVLLGDVETIDEAVDKAYEAAERKDEVRDFDTKDVLKESLENAGYYIFGYNTTMVKLEK